MRRLAPVFLAALLIAATAGAAAEDAVTIPIPRGGRAVNVGLQHGPMQIRSVRLKNTPSRRDLRASRRDRDDTTTLRWIFYVANGGRRDWRARIRVRVVAADNRLLADDSRADEVDARKWKDHISVWTKIRTVDYPAAETVRVTVDFRPS